MPSLEFDNDAKSYRIRFRFGGRAIKRSLHTASVKLARAAAARVEETLMLVAAGRLEIPADADPVAFIMTDGKQSAPVNQSRLMTLGELVRAYQEQRIPGVKELSTIKTEDMHLRLDPVKLRAFCQAINVPLGDFVAEFERRLPKRGREPKA